MPEKRLPYYPYYVTDITRATQEMTDEQFGAYQRLLNYAWERGGLPVDENAIRAIRNWSRGAWARIWPAVGPKWERQGDRLVNGRQESERAKAKARTEQSRAAGAAGGQASARAKAAASGAAGEVAILDLQISDLQKDRTPERSEGALALQDAPERAPAEDGRNGQVRTRFKTPEPPRFKQLYALVKACREKYPNEPVADFIDYCKVECVKAGFMYDGQSIGKALEAYEADQRRRGAA